MNNVAKETLDRVSDMMAARDAQLDEITKEMQKIAGKVAACSARMEDATEKCDLSAYKAAKDKSVELQDAYNMYEARRDKLGSRRLVTEDESDRTIDGLLDYESDLLNDYRDKVREEVKTLIEISKEYSAKVNEAESAIKTWTGNIFPNYRMQNGAYAMGARRDKPLAVRLVPYTGGELLYRANDFIERVRGLLAL